MKAFIAIALALAPVASGAQTVNYDQVQHVATALNHLTVFEVGEPIVTAVIADHDAFEIQREEDKLFLMPLQSGVSTNLLIWTATRQLRYELDPAGDVTKMNVSIRNAPPMQHVPPKDAGSTTPSDQELQRIASLVQAQTLLGTQDILREPHTETTNSVSVELEQVFRAKDRLSIRYSITNLTKSPYRITAPDVSQPGATQQPISLLSLRNHQLSPQTFLAFKAKQGASVPVVSSEFQMQDLAPGQKTTGVISIRIPEENPPQLYQLDFGQDHNHAVIVEVVL